MVKKVILVFSILLFLSCSTSVEYQMTHIQESYGVSEKNIIFITKDNYIILKDSTYYHVRMKDQGINKVNNIREIRIGCKIQ